jgi:hypothetical protein
VPVDTLQHSAQPGGLVLHFRVSNPGECLSSTGVGALGTLQLRPSILTRRMAQAWYTGQRIDGRGNHPDAAPRVAVDAG